MTATLIRWLDATNLIGCLVTPDRQTGDMTEYQCTGLEVSEHDGHRQVQFRLEEIVLNTQTLTGAPLILPTLDGYEVSQPLRDLPVVRSPRALWEDACALVGQLATNRHGAVFLCTDLLLDAASGQVWVDLSDIDEDGQPLGASGVHDLEEFTFHGPLTL